MEKLTAVRSLAFAFVALLPTAGLAQGAFVPPRGEVDFSFTFQWLDADRHLFSDALTGAELTPLEQLVGADFDSASLDFGTIQSQTAVVDVDFGLTDRLALSGGVAFVAPRYLGPFPDSPDDDGLFHSSFQDGRIGARYLAVDRGTWVLTPFASFQFPLSDYPVFGHTARGLGLKELQVGASGARILMFGGAPKAYVEGTYIHSFVENVSDEIKLDRSAAIAEVGYFLGRVTLQLLTSWQHVIGGIEWAEIGHDAENTFGELVEEPGLNEFFHAHDRAAATRDWRMGGGITVDVGNGSSLYLSINDMLWGANTHNATTVTFGINWGFQAFGGLTLGPGTP